MTSSLRLASTLSLALAACAAPPVGDGPADRHALPPPPPAGAPAAQGAATAPIESLSLTSALTLIDAQHPDLEALRLQLEAAGARADAAERVPIPGVVLKVENLPLNRGSSFDQGNYIAGLALYLPLQGRLAAARAVEERAGHLVSRDLELRRHALLRGARDAFVTALVATRVAALQEDAVGSAAGLVRLLGRRIDLGDLTPDEAAWAEVELARARLDAARAASQARRALARLAEALGSDRPIASVTGDLEDTLGLPALEALLARVARSPAVRRAEAEVDVRQAAVELARSERIPDLILDVAYRRLEQTNQHSIDAGVVLLLPFFAARDRARAALAELEASRARARSARLAAAREVEEAYERLSLAVATARGLAGVLPRADAALAAAEARLARGDISALELLPARRAVIALRLEHVEALGESIRAWTDLSAALGSTP
ncbi:MAG: TolC family protein [Planctomycetes bacterium]|nr:TolC family protein [Planctomycetota bacterium]